MEGSKRALFLSGFNDGFNHVRSHILDRVQTETNRFTVWRKVTLRRIDIGGKNRDIHVSGFSQVERTLVFVVLRGRQQGRHVLGLVVRLQKRGPVGHQTVCGRVCLVERVGRERNNDIPEGLD